MSDVVPGRVAAFAVGALTSLAARQALEAAPPGGRDRWERTNHRGETVTLLEGPAVAAALVASAASAPGMPPRVRAAAMLAGGTAGVLGAVDDIAGTAASKGLRGHLSALRNGEVTTGVVKLVGIGLTGLAVGRILKPSAVDAVLAGGVVAGTANLVNLLDLRPGRALKGTVAASVPLAMGGAGGAGLAAATAGVAAAALPDDLDERSMLGDSGANALGAAVGVALASSLSRRGLAGVLVGVAGLTLASERVSFTSVIESTPVLREIDRLGRRPST